MENVMTKANGQPVRPMEKAFVDALAKVREKMAQVDGVDAERWAEQYHCEKALREAIVTANRYGEHFQCRRPLYADMLEA